MLFIKPIKQALVAACLIAPALSVQAWDGVVTGLIMKTEGVAAPGGAPGNYDFRVRLDQNVICNSTIDSSWAYINSSDPNYKGIMAMLLTAYSLGKPVTLLTNKGPTGYCQIGHIYF